MPSRRYHVARDFCSGLGPGPLPDFAVYDRDAQSQDIPLAVFASRQDAKTFCDAMEGASKPTRRPK